MTQQNEWTVVRTLEDGVWTLQLLQNGRDWRMTGAPSGEHCLYDSPEERALAHWNGYWQHGGGTVIEVVRSSSPQKRPERPSRSKLSAL